MLTRRGLLATVLGALSGGALGVSNVSPALASQVLENNSPLEPWQSEIDRGSAAIRAQLNREWRRPDAEAARIQAAQQQAIIDIIRSAMDNAARNAHAAIHT